MSTNSTEAYGNNKLRYGLIFAVCLVLFLDSIGLGIIIPVVPSLFFNSAHGLISIDSVFSSYRGLLYSVSMALLPLSSMLCTTLFGILSDQFGQKRMLLFSMFVCVLGYLLGFVAIFGNFILVLLFGRALEGASSGAKAIAKGMLSGISKTADKKINGFKYMLLASFSGYIVGPGLSIFSSDRYDEPSFFTPFLIALSLWVINLIIILFLFPSDKNVQKNASFASIHRNFNNAIDILRVRQLKLMIFGIFLFELGIAIFFLSLSLYLTLELHYKKHHMEMLFMIFSLSSIFSVIVLHFFISKKITSVEQQQYAIFLMSLCILALAFVKYIFVFPEDEELYIWVVSIVVYILIPIVSLNMTANLSNLVNVESQVKLMTVLGVIAPFAFVIASFLVGMAVFHEHLVLVVSAMFMLCGWCILNFYLSPKRRLNR